MLPLQWMTSNLVQGGTQNTQWIVSENDENFDANKSWLFLPTPSDGKETLGLLTASSDLQRGLGGMGATGWNSSHEKPYEPWLKSMVRKGSLWSCPEVFFQPLVARAGCKWSCVAARRGLCLCQKHMLSLAGELSLDRNQLYSYHLCSSPVGEIIIAMGRSCVSPGGKLEVLGSWGFSWCGKSLGGSNPVYWAVCHPCCRHPGTLLGVAPIVFCLQILQSHHMSGVRCDGKGLRRLPGNLPVLISLPLHTSGSAPVYTLGELLELSSAPAREASS